MLARLVALMTGPVRARLEDWVASLEKAQSPRTYRQCGLQLPGVLHFLWRFLH